MTPDKFLARFNIFCKQVRCYAKLAKKAIGLHRKIDVLNGTIAAKDKEIQRLKGEIFKGSVKNAELEKQLRLAGVRNPLLKLRVVAPVGDFHHDNGS